MRHENKDLQQMMEQLSLLYEILLGLERDVAAKNPRLYEIMAEGPMDQIDELRHQIDEAVGLSTLRESRADVWLSLQGEGIDVQSTPSSLLASYLDAVRKGVQDIAQVNLEDHLAAHSKKELKEACDLQLVDLQPGSIRIGLRLPDDAGQDDPQELIERRQAASSALDEYLEAVAWAAQGRNEEWLRERFPERAKRKALLGAVKSLAPSGRSAVESVSLSGRRMPGAALVTLTQNTGRSLSLALERLEAPQLGTYEGVLREIDLDRGTFLIREARPGRAVRCSFPAGLSERAKQALDHRVRVTGVAREPGSRGGTVDLKVQDLVILDE
jgi:hypothetical protein